MSKRNNKTGSAKPANKAAASKFAVAATTAGLAPQPGMSVVEGRYRPSIQAKPDWKHTGSVDLDAHFVAAEPGEPRWDYGLGIANGVHEFAFWVEPHGADSTGRVDEVIAKKRWLDDKLSQPPFGELSAMTDAASQAGHSAYNWVFSSSMRILKNSPEAKRLAKAGIRMIRHLQLPS
ncbi:hypothetical protein [Trinickia fusca]|uniref:Uncharacterized protein n=1 Tax=Trinickia fusca TaxID=2419777 RepID=A0A494X5G5_9BURK|nr:hypothetical protein [Trinickia fusca]RKP45935.1 hypothetical protein D7S89_18315 [Trinickia fusca]